MGAQPESSKSGLAHTMSSPGWNAQGPLRATTELPMGARKGCLWAEARAEMKTKTKSHDLERMSLSEDFKYGGS